MNSSDVVVCNGPMITATRKSCQMTQEDLAAASGYSVRVIRKAEDNGQVRYSTLVSLSQAFQRSGSACQPGDLCTDSVEVACAFMAAFRIHRTDLVPQIQHLLHDSLEIDVAGDPHATPFAGTWYGTAGLIEFCSHYFTAHESDSAIDLPVEYFSNGTDVVAFGSEARLTNQQRAGERRWLVIRFRISSGVISHMDVCFNSGSYSRKLGSC